MTSTEITVDSHLTDLIARVRCIRADAYRDALATLGVILTGGEQYAAVDAWCQLDDPDAPALIQYRDRGNRIAAATFPSFTTADLATRAEMRRLAMTAASVLA